MTIAVTRETRPCHDRDPGHPGIPFHAVAQRINRHRALLQRLAAGPVSGDALAREASGSLHEKQALRKVVSNKEVSDV